MASERQLVVGLDVPGRLLQEALTAATLLFVACVLTYLAMAAFAASCGKAHWIGRRAGQAFVALNLVAVVLILMRGLSFPDPRAGTTPWYTRPGFIAGIPAVPWIMPHLLGAALLRRAGTEQL